MCIRDRSVHSYIKSHKGVFDDEKLFARIILLLEYCSRMFINKHESGLRESDARMARAVFKDRWMSKFGDEIKEAREKDFIDEKWKKSKVTFDHTLPEIN